MTKLSSQFIRLDFSILEISGLTYADKIVLAYNRSFDNAGGYFASNKRAAQSLFMNIKTFEKSVCKLKRMGLWKIKGQVVSIKQRPTLAEVPPSGEGKHSTGENSLPTRVEPHPTRGDKISAILPLKNDVLLDSLLDNRLENYKEEILDSAGEAANESISSSLEESNSKTHNLKHTYFKSGSEGSYSNFADSASSKDNRSSFEDITHKPHSFTNGPRVPPPPPPRGPTGKCLRDVDMVSANLEAWKAGTPEPFTKAQIASAKHWERCSSREIGPLDEL